jgi:hypothetical protein
MFKGIPNVIDSYHKFRNLLKERSPDLTEEEHPQLLLCGHGAVDDPDASIIYDQIMQILATEPHNKYAKDIVVMRLPPSDQCEYYFLRTSMSPVIDLEIFFKKQCLTH